MSSILFAQLCGRLRRILKHEKIDQKEFSERLGISAGYASELLSGKKGKISDTLAKLISHEFKVNYDWLLTGEGEMYVNEFLKAIAYPWFQPEEYTYVPKYDLNIVTDAEGCVVSEGFKHPYAFRTEWLKRICPADQRGLFSLRGNSMLPSIGDGDLVLVDMSKKELRDIIDGQIYVFSEGDLLKVKRLVRKGSGLLAISDNKAEIPNPLEVDMEQFRLIGNVVWIGHMVK